MTQSVGVGSAWKPVAAKWVGVGSAWKEVFGEWVGVGGVWKQSLVTAITVAVSPNPNNQATTSAVGNFSQTASVSGGSGFYTYSWALDISDGTWVLVSGQGTPTANYRTTVGAIGSTADATAICTVTDTVSGVVGTGSADMSYLRT